MSHPKPVHALYVLLAFAPVAALPAEEDLKKGLRVEAPAAKAGALVAALPKDTLLLFHVPNAKMLVEKGKKSPFYGLKDHPELKGIISRLREGFEKGLAGAKDDLGFDPMEILSSLQGEATVAIGNLDQLAGELGQALSMGQEPSPDLNKFPFLLAADAGGSSAKLKEHLGKVYAFVEKKGAKKTISDFRGGKITVLTKAGSGPPKGAGGQDEEEGGDEEGGKKGGQDVSICFGELGNHVFFSPSRAFLERCMGNVVTPGPESLEKNALFDATRKGLGGSGDLLVYLDVKQLTNTINRALSSSFFAFYWTQFESFFFGQSFNTLGLNLVLEDTGVREGSFCHNGGASDGILGLFKADSFPATPPAFLPEKTENFTSLGFNPVQLEKMVRQVGQIIQSFTQQGADLDALFEQNYGVKLKDLTAALGRRLHAFGALPAAATDLQNNPFASLDIVVELKEEGPVKQLLQKTSAMFADKVKVSKYKEKDIFSLSEGPGGPTVALADKMLIASFSPKRVESMIDKAAGGGPKLAASEDYMRVMKFLPPQVVVLAFSTQNYLKAYMKTVGDAIPADSDEDTKAIKSALAAVGDVLGPSVMYGSWTDSGIHTETIYLYRQK